MLIGQKLRELIVLRNIKQVKLAEHLGIAPSRLSSYISGKREPSLKMLAQIAHCLQVDLNYFSDIDFQKKTRIPARLKKRQKIEIEVEPSKPEFVFEPPMIHDAVEIPYFPINAKKREAKDLVLRVTTDYLKFFNLDDAVVIKVTTATGTLKPGDYIIAEKINKKLNNGDIIVQTGRICDIMRYVEHQNKRYLAPLYGSTIMEFNERVQHTSYLAKWVMTSVR